MNGGDLRQSVYRAIRHGLMQAHSMLLEPFYAFHLTIPDKMVGRAMTDLERRFAVFEGPVLEDGQAILTGRAPVSCLDGVSEELLKQMKKRKNRGLKASSELNLEYPDSGLKMLLFYIDTYEFYIN